jgi:hypothetical protein
MNSLNTARGPNIKADSPQVKAVVGFAEDQVCDPPCWECVNY